MICKICFKNFEYDSFSALLCDTNICYECYSKMIACMKTKNIKGVDVLFIYEQNEFIESLLYQYKELLDYDLASSFLCYHQEYFKFLMKFCSVICYYDKSYSFTYLNYMLKAIGCLCEDFIVKEDDNYLLKKNTRNRKKVILFIEYILSDIELNKLINFLHENNIRIYKIVCLKN